MNADMALPEASDIVDALQSCAGHALVILADVLPQLVSNNVHIVVRGVLGEVCGG